MLLEGFFGAREYVSIASSELELKLQPDLLTP